MKVLPLAGISASLAIQGVVAYGLRAESSNTTIVDLGYAVHQGSLNSTYNFYSFKNIRYGEAPVGELRWRPSIPPQQINRTLNDGSVERQCPQAFPRWLLEPQAANAGLPVETLANIILSDKRLNEDCLFLDVHVPTKVFAKRGKSGSGAAVMLWIHGGGYAIGYKDQSPFNTPAGLIERSTLDNQEGVIFISINYRLGMFGFLNRNGTDMVGNAGFWDQRTALEWVQKHIHLFGGDRNRVTVIGESAGAGSIVHQITAFGGKGKAPFAAAIVQSPALPMTDLSAESWETTVAAASKIAGKPIQNIQDLRQLNSSALMQINQAASFNSLFGTFTYVPTVDGEFSSDLPGVLLEKGHFYQNVKVMAGHNKNESGMFTPEIKTEEEFLSYFDASQPMPASERDLILSQLYPNVLDGTFGYTTQFGRANLLFDEMTFSCNTRWLGTAFLNQTYNYRFEYPPGSHGQDLAWTFFVKEDPAVNAELAISMQRYFTNFAMKGDPNGEGVSGLAPFPVYSEQANLAIFGQEGVGTAVDGLANHRCDYWQKGTFRSR